LARLTLAGDGPPSMLSQPKPLAASNEQRFLALIRGERRGPVAMLARLGLRVASWLYGAGVRFRNLAFSRGWREVVRVAVPVVSVGNLTVGGTGKTPCVEFVARFYRDLDRRVAILSRGYGVEAGRNDEALVLEETLPDVPHLQDADRVGIARTAIEELESEILVLDDGFQHRRLHRDIDLVLVDATDPWGLGATLPRGLLREPLSSLRRADAIIVTRADQVSSENLTKIDNRLSRVAPNKPIAHASHRPTGLVNSDGASESVEYLRERSVTGFCGIGNPEAFRRTLVGLGARVIDFRAFPDHHPYSREDVVSLRQTAGSLPDDTLFVTTHKDLVKLRISDLAGRPLWALRIEMTFQTNQAAIESVLARVLDAPGGVSPQEEEPS
jgi:tetraacyldisaccharide 4'-kinase